MNDEHEIREVEAPDAYRVETIEVFDCNCGNTLRADVRTECRQCQTHYSKSGSVMRCLEDTNPTTSFAKQLSTEHDYA